MTATSRAIIELDEFITPKRVEWAYGFARRAMKNKQDGVAEAGLRAARRQDPKLLKALDKMANILDAEAESQMGRTIRDTGTPFSERILPTEAQLVREAYVACDERPEDPNLANFSWLFGAAAVVAGLYY